ncbi:alpha-L-rhamnosidase C-terminal domain-containing protein [uncultured Sunxiuqinia sp.]|uniref:alpha-L-rhamnosidase-related protein n=1 Tax=uncultured Sunxiuqinia sp. TaxID=1573825 RepID=UPI002AA8A80D|nr:alpha-L-rhamnosidase C-terminal domain-containing protein [uncultured Sunxiuqinia sp.]
MKQNRILLILLIVIFPLIAKTQERPVDVNTDWNNQRHMWQAAWITHPTASVFDYSVFNFRKKFNLNELRDSSIIFVSADNRYRLFVNEIEVARGPAKSNLQYWKYETINIAPYLRKGENIIAAEVFNLGEFRPASQFSSRTAFILQGDGYLSEKLNTGNTNWLVTHNKAYKSNPVTKKMVRHFFVAGPCDSIAANLYPWGWQTTNYDDRNWLAPKRIEPGVGRGFLHGVSWHLAPREIPMMEERVTRFKKIVRAESIEVDPQFLSGRKKLIVPANSTVKFLLDHEKLTIGYPEMIVSGGNNSVIKVTYAEALYDKNGKKGNRNIVDGKEMQGYYDVFLPDGGAKRKFVPLSLRTCRYVELEITTEEKPLEIDDFYLIFTAYPFKENAFFKTDDPLLTQIWNTGWWTARLCAGETYMDCPYWEQLQYIGDSRIQALISLYVSGDDRLMRNLLLEADQSRMSEGLTMGRPPTNNVSVIPTFSLYWVDMVHDYYMHRSDSAFVLQFLPGIRSVLGWFERRMDDNGLLGSLDWFNFTDWADGFMCGMAYGADSGNSALISLQFAYALDNASELFQHFGHDYEASKYKNLASKIKDAVYQLSFNKQKGFFRDTPTDDIYSQHTNIWAVLTDAIPQSEQKELIERVITEKSLIQTSIYFRFYLFQAMYKAGLANDYLSQLGDWKQMIEKGLSTFEEGDYLERSDCHAWGASPNYDFLATVCGIRPLKSGFKEVSIKPAFGDLKTVHAKMPHPKGKIEMKLTVKGESGIIGFVSLPENTTGTFEWFGKHIQISPGKNIIDLN